MDTNKLKIAICLACSIGVFACAGSQKTKTQNGASVQQTMEPVDVPSKITKQKRQSWEKILLVLPAEHPDRRALRDVLVASFAEEFEQLDPDKLADRRKIVEACLWLHLPLDFEQGNIAPSIQGMAVWALKKYSKRGDEAFVSALLHLLIKMDADNASYQEELDILMDWSKAARQHMEDPIDRLSSLIDVKSASLAIVPSVDAAVELGELLIERFDAIEKSFANPNMDTQSEFDPRAMFVRGQLRQSFADDIIAAYFLAGDLAGARPVIRKLVEDERVSRDYLTLLKKIVKNRDAAEGYYTIALDLINRTHNLRAGLRACVMARNLERANPRYSLCIGQSLEMLERTECAVDFYLEAVAGKPGPEVLAETMTFIRDAIWRLHQKGDREATEEAMKAAVSLIDGLLAETQNPDEEISERIATLLFVLGNIEFDDGRIEDANNYLNRSFKIWKSPAALFKLADIAYWQDNFTYSLELLETAALLEENELQANKYNLAIVAERKGKVLQALGQGREATMQFETALRYWNSSELRINQGASVGIRRGEIFGSLGKLEDSIEEFRGAIRMDPNRSGTYTEVLSYLVTMGRLEDAEEFYRLAYNQDRIEAIWKTYYALWLEGLTQRRAGKSLDLAKGYLENSTGDSWQDSLAQFFVGKIKFDELGARAKTHGQKVEANFYSAVLDLVAGRKDEAQQKLLFVTSSNLMGFYEYRMAREILKKEF